MKFLSFNVQWDQIIQTHYIFLFKLQKIVEVAIHL